MFKNMTVGKQIGLGFGIVLVLLVAVGVWSYIGVGGIVQDATSMITGEQIIGEMKAKEIDHLNWVAGLTEYLSDPDVKELNIETDHKKCGLGGWMYGEGRKNAETAMPVLASLFSSMEKPHEFLHQSGSDIAKKMNKLDVAEELTRFYRVEIAHRQWISSAISEISAKQNAVSVELDHKQCGLGKWLYSGEAQELATEFPAFAPLIEKMKEPHRLVHEAGKTINAELASRDYDGAMAVVTNVVEPNFEIITGVFREARNLVRGFEKGQNEAANIFVTVTQKNLSEVQEIMHRVSETAGKNMVTQEVLLGGASRLKLIVTVLGIVALVLGAGLAFFIS